MQPGDKMDVRVAPDSGAPMAISFRTALESVPVTIEVIAETYDYTRQGR